MTTRHVVDMAHGGTIRPEPSFPLCGEPLDWAPGHAAPCTRAPEHDGAHRTDPAAFLAGSKRDGDTWTWKPERTESGVG